MRQFIKDNRPYAQTSREDFAQKYLDEGYEVCPILYDGVFIDPIWNGSEFIEGATPEEIAEQEQSEQLRKETEMYKKRTQDGINAYAEISAEFRLAKLSGILTEEQHGAIEAILIPVRNEVLAGQWISARQKLEEIGVVIGVQLYNRLHTQISNYINKNY